MGKSSRTGFESHEKWTEFSAKIITGINGIVLLWKDFSRENMYSLKVKEMSMGQVK
jgi:hypothetical protein